MPRTPGLHPWESHEGYDWVQREGCVTPGQQTPFLVPVP